MDVKKLIYRGQLITTMTREELYTVIGFLYKENEKLLKEQSIFNKKGIRGILDDRHD